MDRQAVGTTASITTPVFCGLAAGLAVALGLGLADGSRRRLRGEEFGRLIRLRIHLHSRSHLFNAPDDDLVANFEWSDDHLHLSLGRAELHRHWLHNVVRTNKHDEIIPLQLHRRGLGNNERVLQFLHRRGDTGKQTGPKKVITIGKQCRNLNSAGRHVDLSIHKIETALFRINLTIGKSELQPRLYFILRCRLQLFYKRIGLQILLLRDGEIHLDGIDLRHLGEDS